MAGEAPSVKAYDAYVKTSLMPFCEACDDLGGLQNIGTFLQDAFEGVRTIVVLASRAKAPSEDLPTALMSYLTPTQEAVKKIRDVKVDRDFDRHYKAITEMLACLSWVLMAPPAQLPVASIKEALGSAEFWTNRIRKDFKGKDDLQIEFCDTLKKAVVGLVEYVDEYHKAGLSFNPRGMSLTEAGLRLSDEPIPEPDIKSPKQKRHPTLGTVVPGGNMAGLMGELQLRKSADGSSAATGLKHVSRQTVEEWGAGLYSLSTCLAFQVTKDQQTWRKEFKKEVAAPKSLPMAPLLDGPAKKAEPKKKKPLLGLPIFEYQDRGFKWVVENHTKESVIKEASPNGVLTIEITDPKQQVYVYNCEGVTLQVKGKFKSLILDKCTKCNVVYDTLISSAEMVNCKKVQLQVNGVCPVFTIDKTVNVLIWLSKESLHVSTFTTSLSSEMNVNFPDGEDMKELPIPEQFVHKLDDKLNLTSEVSDLYH